MSLNPRFGCSVIDLTAQQTSRRVKFVPEPIAHRHQVISFTKTRRAFLSNDRSGRYSNQGIYSKENGVEHKNVFNWKTSLDFGLSKYHSSLEKEIKYLFTPSAKPLSTAPEGRAVLMTL